MKNKPLSYKIWVITFVAALVYYALSGMLFPTFYRTYQNVNMIVGIYGFFSLALFLIFYLYNKNRS
ncbi:MAG: hypothetical protein GVY19_06825 [Bacteroidetes bacterium]|jgi:beta-lactamase regulating signal transducer with metallopeptidase domain|nr:hypothetical protein [Bacteroidota bacterium]